MKIYVSPKQHEYYQELFSKDLGKFNSNRVSVIFRIIREFGLTLKQSKEVFRGLPDNLVVVPNTPLEYHIPSHDGDTRSVIILESEVAETFTRVFLDYYKKDCLDSLIDCIPEETAGEDLKDPLRGAFPEMDPDLLDLICSQHPSGTLPVPTEGSLNLASFVGYIDACLSAGAMLSTAALPLMRSSRFWTPQARALLNIALADRFYNEARTLLRDSENDGK